MAASAAFSRTASGAARELPESMLPGEGEDGASCSDNGSDVRRSLESLPDVPELPEQEFVSVRRGSTQKNLGPNGEELGEGLGGLGGGQVLPRPPALRAARLAHPSCWKPLAGRSCRLTWRFSWKFISHIL